MVNESAPLISIIVAVYNGKATLQQCIDSVVQQTYPNKELIVIDGGSSDGTVELLGVNSNKLSFWISEPDNGIYNAWNKGLEQASGEWICFLGADDYFWNDTVLERMAAQLIKLPASIRVAYGQIMQIGNDGKSSHIIGEPWLNIKEAFKQHMCIPHVGTMHRKKLFELRGKFDESFGIAGDYELLLRELITGDAAFIPDLIVAGQRLGGLSTLGTNYLVTLREVRRAQKIHQQDFSRTLLMKLIFREYLLLLLWKLLGERSARNLLDLRRRIKGLPPYWTKT